MPTCSESCWGVKGRKAKGEADEGGEVMAETIDDVIRRTVLMNERQQRLINGCSRSSH